MDVDVRECCVRNLKVKFVFHNSTAPTSFVFSYLNSIRALNGVALDRAEGVDSIVRCRRSQTAPIAVYFSCITWKTFSKIRTLSS